MKVTVAIVDDRYTSLPVLLNCLCAIENSMLWSEIQSQHSTNTNFCSNSAKWKWHLIRQMLVSSLWFVKTNKQKKTKEKTHTSKLIDRL